MHCSSTSIHTKAHPWSLKKESETVQGTAGQNGNFLHSKLWRFMVRTKWTNPKVSQCRKRTFCMLVYSWQHPKHSECACSGSHCTVVPGDLVGYVFNSSACTTFRVILAGSNEWAENRTTLNRTRRQTMFPFDSGKNRLWEMFAMCRNNIWVYQEFLLIV